MGDVNRARAVVFSGLLGFLGCGSAGTPPSASRPAPTAVAMVTPAVAVASAEPVAVAPPPPENPIVVRARLEVERGVTYDAAWFAIGYPNGDPQPDRGVCTDVVIRSYRTTGFDFQQRVHEDILKRPAAYKTVRRPDRHIDHRRVAPMLTYLRAYATALPKTFDADSGALASWEPGDIVVWGFRPCPACTPDHVGIVSDRKGPRGVPLVIHNVGPKPSEDDRLDTWTVLGHFRSK